MGTLGGSGPVREARAEMITFPSRLDSEKVFFPQLFIVEKFQIYTDVAGTVKQRAEEVKETKVLPGVVETGPEGEGAARNQDGLASDPPLPLGQTTALNYRSTIGFGAKSVHPLPSPAPALANKVLLAQLRSFTTDTIVSGWFLRRQS